MFIYIYNMSEIKREGSDWLKNSKNEILVLMTMNLDIFFICDQKIIRTTKR